MSLQGTRSSQPFGLSNKSAASTHEQCTSTRLGSTFMGDNKPMESTIGRLSLYSGPIIDLPMENEADCFFWHSLKLMWSVNCTWNCLEA
jgi:hypothetical protein